ncbi:hypothetical protein [Alcanivorax sp. 1008]|uniref:hypothetical protein n=1 Tax=Alcanivorax sp. 1008 TaxID=2816853 RepID=UPI001D538E42|nr:hypothetical protein [Alcanivorax sp. 1008]MCC1497808.1 hypothetical protein [Alcanivorax sp. 1008]
MSHHSLCLSLLLSSCLLMQPAQAAEQEQCQTSKTVHSHAQSRQVLQALTQDDLTDRQTVLEQYLAAPPGTAGAVDRVALNRARLTLAAEYLSKSRFIEARQLLSAIELDSTVAVQASLLLAESFRLEGDPQRAAQWLLRTGQRYGADPEALRGLLEQASELRQQGQLAQAFAIYNMVQGQILNNAEQVNSLRSATDRLVEQLLRTRLDESRAAQSQMLKQMINNTDSQLLSELGALARSSEQRHCLEKQLQQLSRTAFENSAQQARITPFLTMLKREQEMLEQRLAQLEGNSQADATQERAEISQQLEALLNRRQTLLAEQQQLPGGAALAHDQLREQIELLDQQNQQRRQRIETELELLSSELLARYRKLAAESQYGRASLLEARHRGG